MSFNGFALIHPLCPSAIPFSAEANMGMALSCDAARAIVPILRIDQ